jgi:hypothetical protein
VDTRARYYLLRHLMRYHHRQAEIIVPRLIEAATGRSPERLIQRLIKRRSEERAGIVIACTCLALMFRDQRNNVGG